MGNRSDAPATKNIIWNLLVCQLYSVVHSHLRSPGSLNLTQQNAGPASRCCLGDGLTSGPGLAPVATTRASEFGTQTFPRSQGRGMDGPVRRRKDMPIEESYWDTHRMILVFCLCCVSIFLVGPFSLSFLSVVWHSVLLFHIYIRHQSSIVTNLQILVEISRWFDEMFSKQAIGSDGMLGWSIGLAKCSGTGGAGKNTALTHQNTLHAV